MQTKVQHALDILLSWSEGFALSFVFSSEAPDADLDAEVLSWTNDASVDRIVEDVLAQLGAARPVVLDFRSCGLAVLQDAARRLNERRARLEQMRHPVVFVCQAGERLVVQYAAPDLWHIRTMVPEDAPS